MLAVNQKDDPHALLAEKLGITRHEAKLANIALGYLTHPLCNDRSAAFNLLRCHEICVIWPGAWGAAKSEKWGWLTQNQPFDLLVAINIILKFLPEGKELNAMNPMVQPLNLRDRLTMARGIAARATSEAQLVKIEELLRPLAYFLNKEGHRVYQ